MARCALARSGGGVVASSIMERRSFLQSLPAAGAAPLAFGPAGAAADEAGVAGRLPFGEFRELGFRGPRTLLFLDYWPLMRCEDLEIKQATAEYLPEGRFIDPLLGQRTYDMVGSVPWLDEEAGLWRRFCGYPDLYAYESEDAVRWRISEGFGPGPAGGRKHPHHVYRSPVGGFGSSVLHHPEAADGYRFRMLVLEHIGPSYRHALEHPESFWHAHALEAKAKGGARAFHARKHSMLVSRDGREWELRRDFDWGTPPLITEEHYCLFHNHHSGDYTAVHRARWGDRRLFQSMSPDCREWSVPRQMLHPDVLDEGRIEFHGSAINRYDSYYIGLLWYGNYTSFDAPAWSGGPDSTHLIHSYDGKHFVRGHRQPLIPLRQRGQPPLRGLWSRGILPKDDEILLYSDTYEFDPEVMKETVATPYDTANEARKRRNAGAIGGSVIHRLRKDGFTYLEPVGEWGQCQTLFLTLFDPEVTINADARAGELWYEVGLIGRDNVADGFSYDDCVPMVHADSTGYRLRFRDKDLGDLLEQPIYFRFKLKRVRLYSLRGDFSTDFTHRHRIEKGMPLVNPSWLF